MNMKYLVWLFAVLIFSASSAYGAAYCEKITVADTAIGFTSSKITNTSSGVFYTANRADCTLETANIRFRTDTTSPDSSTGLLVAAGQSFSVTDHDDLVNFKAIRTGSNSGTLNCCYK